MEKEHPFIIGITGASGSIYGVKLIEQMLIKQQNIILTITNAGKIVLEKELNINLFKNGQTAIEQYLIKSPQISKKMVGNSLEYISVDKIDGVIASGSFKTKGMAIVPCSMSTLSSVSNGRSSNLIERAADVVLKEGLPLLLSPREMPLNTIHLENMLKLSKMGVIISPPMPAFYHQPQTIDDMVNFVVGKILDRLNLENNLYKRWEG
ncbi:MAG: UbiX family flavin prenyltransferase [Halanaerobiales bacterium]|nr:UbiX family flavin prenyltransferase [Halanaerobiales bacterium]